MTTALKLITQALRIVGVSSSGETLPPDEANEGLDTLNQLMDEWSNEGLMTYHVSNNLYNVLPNVAEYDIGPGATWDTKTSRPLTIQKWGSFVRQTLSSGVTNDYRLQYWPNESYQNVFLKGQTTNFPSRFTYLPGYPVAKIILWPMPTKALQFNLSSLDQFAHYNLSDTFELPPGYESAIVYNLALILSIQYGQELPPIVMKKALDTKSNIMTINQDSVYMNTELALTHNPRYPFNIFSGA